MEGGDVLTFAGTRAGFEQGFGQFRAILDRYPLQSRTRYGCELVFEEIVRNIIRHGYADNQEHYISMTVPFTTIVSNCISKTMARRSIVSVTASTVEMDQAARGRRR